MPKFEHLKTKIKKSYIQIEELKIPIDLYTEKFEEKKNLCVTKFISISV